MLIILITILESKEILGNDKKGRIVIDYYNADELQKIYDSIIK